MDPRFYILGGLAALAAVAVVHALVRVVVYIRVSRRARTARRLHASEDLPAEASTARSVAEPSEQPSLDDDPFASTAPVALEPEPPAPGSGPAPLQAELTPLPDETERVASLIASLEQPPLHPAEALGTERFDTPPAPAAQASERAKPRVQEYRLVAPVELHFTEGAGRVGVRPGTRTHDEFQRLAGVLLSDLREARSRRSQ